LNQELLICLEI